MSTTRPYDVMEEINKVVENKFWESDELEILLKKKEEFYRNKLYMEYKDNYLVEHKNNMSFQAVANFLPVNLDYMEKGLSKVESVDVLKEKLKNEYDISVLSGLNQRIGNLISQHPSTQ